MPAVALEEARAGPVEGGVPVGAALFTHEGKPLSRGRNHRVQQGDSSRHNEVICRPPS
jgi:creatinine deaminase